GSLGVDGVPGDPGELTDCGALTFGGTGGVHVCEGALVSGGNGGSTRCPRAGNLQHSGAPGAGGGGGGGGAGSCDADVAMDFDGSCECGIDPTCWNDGADGRRGAAGRDGTGGAAGLRPRLSRWDAGGLAPGSGTGGGPATAGAG